MTLATVAQYSVEASHQEVGEESKAALVAVVVAVLIKW
jgi:hypothetical protein